MRPQTDIELRPGCERRCPGCAHRHLSPAASEQLKQLWLTKTLAEWADRIAVINGVEGEARWAYRDKVCLSSEWRDGCWHVGMKLGDEVLAIHRCPVHSPRVRRTLHVLLARLPGPENFPLAFFVQNGAQLTLVLKTRDMPDTSWLDPDCRRQLEHAGIEGLWLHLHPAVGRKIFNKPGWHLLYGVGRSRNDEGLLYGPTAFQQLIPHLYRSALDSAESFLEPSPDTVTVDLYSGTGATLQRWSRAGSETTGVELGAEACECARLNAPRAATLRGKCAHRIPQLNAWSDQDRLKSKRRLLYLNPPRTGLDENVRSWITENYRPARIAYLSCSAGTLKRDLSALNSAGYRVQTIIPFDFFPNTYHVETLTLLLR
jgi:23S rRNA (uracil1939-C5)-methyltransferase